MFYVESTGQFWDDENGSWCNHTEDATAYGTQAAARAVLASEGPAAEDDAGIVYEVTTAGEEGFSVLLKVVAFENKCAFHRAAQPVATKVEAHIGGFLAGRSVTEDDTIAACASCADLVAGTIKLITGRKPT